MIRILLAVDPIIFRSGLRSLLEREPDFQIVVDAADAEEAVRSKSQAAPDVLVLDLQLPGILNPSAMKALCDPDANAHALVLAESQDSRGITEALRAGARGVVLKNSGAKVLAQAIRGISNGGFWLSADPEVSASHQAREVPLNSTPKNFGLTKRELQIVAAILSGYSNREIAERYSISEDTVKHHLTNVFDKVGVYNRLELALFAIHHGLVSPH